MLSCCPMTDMSDIEATAGKRNRQIVHQQVSTAELLKNWTTDNNYYENPLNTYTLELFRTSTYSLTIGMVQWCDINLDIYAQNQLQSRMHDLTNQYMLLVMVCQPLPLSSIESKRSRHRFSAKPKVFVNWTFTWRLSGSDDNLSWVSWRRWISYASPPMTIKLCSVRLPCCLPRTLHKA